MLSEVEIHLDGGCPAFVIHECLLHGKVEDCVLGHIGTIAQAQVQHVGNGSGRTGGRELTDAPSHVPAIITLPVAVTPPVTLPVAVIEPTLIVPALPASTLPAVMVSALIALAFTALALIDVASILVAVIFDAFTSMTPASSFPLVSEISALPVIFFCRFHQQAANRHY